MRMSLEPRKKATAWREKSPRISWEPTYLAIDD